VAAGGEHVFGVTRFSDETQEEFDRRYKGRKSHGKGVRKGVAIRRPLAWTSARMEREGEEEGGKEGGGPVQKRPAMVDWVEAGATTSVANQGQCGVSVCLSAFPPSSLILLRFKLACDVGVGAGRFLFFIFKTFVNCVMIGRRASFTLIDLPSLSPSLLPTLLVLLGVLGHVTD